MEKEGRRHEEEEREWRVVEGADERVDVKSFLGV